MADAQIGNIWPPTPDIPNPPNMSYVFFVDGFDHYTDLEDKWTTVSGGSIVTESGTWYDLPSTNPNHLYDTVRKRGNALSFSGDYSPGDSLPYVEMDLQDLAKLRTIVSMNLKCDEFTGVPFVQLYDESYNLIGGFAFTPEGQPHTMYGSLYQNYRFCSSGSMYTHPGHWVNVRCGVGYVVTQGTPALGLRFDVNFNKPVGNFSLFYDIDPSGLAVKYVRIGPAGNNTLISDLICCSGQPGMINEGNNIHTLFPKADGGYIDGSFVGDTHNAVDEYPPNEQDKLQFTVNCEHQVWAYVDAPVLDASIDPLAAASFSRGADAFTGSLTFGHETSVQPEMYGLVYQAYGTVQMNAMSNGTKGAIGIVSPPSSIWQLYALLGRPGGYVGLLPERDQTVDGDSNTLFHAQRNAWKYDITQICHWHRWLRYLWRTNTFNNVWAGVMAVDIQ